MAKKRSPAQTRREKYLALLAELRQQFPHQGMSRSQAQGAVEAAIEGFIDIFGGKYPSKPRKEPTHLGLSGYLGPSNPHALNATTEELVRKKPKATLRATHSKLPRLRISHRK